MINSFKNNLVIFIEHINKTKILYLLYKNNKRKLKTQFKKNQKK